MTYAAARVAVAVGVDPMVVLEWPPDVFVAVVEVLSGTDPDTLESGFDVLKAFALANVELEP